MQVPRIITLLSDFGSRDAYVGIMKGVMLGICPAAHLVDLSHQVPPQAVTIGALLLRSAIRYFPIGSVHLAVVDPGVGSERNAIAVIGERAILVGPDNGLLVPAAMMIGRYSARRLTCTELFVQPVSATFHGRDVFAPVAAHLAAGVAPETLGPELPELQPLALPAPRVERSAVCGEVIYVDHFGNLITNIDVTALRAFRPHTVSVSIAETMISHLVDSYAAAAPASPLALIGSWGLLEVAVRDGNAAAALRAGIATRVTVTGE